MTKGKSNQEFQIGETVKIISGGPTMTVKNPNYFDWVMCQWFAGKKLEEGQFASESLIRVDINEKEE